MLGGRTTSAATEAGAPVPLCNVPRKLTETSLERSARALTSIGGGAGLGRGAAAKSEAQEIPPRFFSMSTMEKRPEGKRPSLSTLPRERLLNTHCKRRKEKGVGGATPVERARFHRELPTTAKEGVGEPRGLHRKTQGQHKQKAQPLRTRRQHHPTPAHVRELQVGPSG